MHTWAEVCTPLGQRSGSREFRAPPARSIGRGIRRLKIEMITCSERFFMKADQRKKMGALDGVRHMERSIKNVKKSKFNVSFRVPVQSADIALYDPSGCLVRVGNRFPKSRFQECRSKGRHRDRRGKRVNDSMKNQVFLEGCTSKGQNSSRHDDAQKRNKNKRFQINWTKWAIS